MTPENLPTQEKRKEHANAIGGPFGIILNPLGDIAVTAGESCELGITIINDAQQTPLVNIFIDETSTTVRQWCFTPEKRLALGIGKSSEVIFRFEVPLDVDPGSYEYVVVIDAPDHYPEDTPILLYQRMQVLPYVQEARMASDPTFALQPATQSTSPIPLQQGQPLELTVLVDNRSDRVDRFRLTCPDLDPQWFKIIYPDNFSFGGILSQSQHLELNPSDRGIIRIIITPPLDALAGIYTPTLSLKSANNPDLVLLDVVYFQVLPVYLLTAELVTIVSRIKKQNGLVTLFLQNQGNTSREVQIEVTGEEDTANFIVEPEQVTILPSGSAAISIEIEPTKRFRPFYARLIDFNIKLTDIEGHALPAERFPGSVVWEGRPWWQFLIVILLAIGAVGTVIFLIWLFFPRPPKSPEIIDFSPQNSFYEEENGDAVRLNWQVSEPQRIKTLKVEGVSPDGVVMSRPVEYDLTDGIPEALEDFCKIEVVLICINVPTDARKPGDYIFQLTASPVIPRRRGILSRIWRVRLTPMSQETNIVRIAATPTPEVVEFKPTQANYVFVPQRDGSLLSIARIDNPERPTGEDEETPETEQSATEAPELPPPPDTEEDNPLEGDTEGENSPEEDTEGEDTQTENPLINNFEGENPEDEETETTPGSDNAAVENGDTAQTPEPAENAARQRRQQLIRDRSVSLNWKISNPVRLKELTLVGRAPDDTIVFPEITFDFSLGVPPELQNFCVIENQELRCEQVNTGITQEGTYIFELLPVSNIPQEDPPEPIKTDPIKVTRATAPLSIRSLTINGSEALPKYVLQVNPQGEPIILTIGWNVQGGGEEVSVELQPSPGSVPRQGVISYPLSQEPGTEMITLIATNAEGAEVSRSFTIDKLTPEEIEAQPEPQPGEPQPVPVPVPQPGQPVPQPGQPQPGQPQPGQPQPGQPQPVPQPGQPQPVPQPQPGQPQPVPQPGQPQPVPQPGQPQPQQPQPGQPQPQQPQPQQPQPEQPEEEKRQPPSEEAPPLPVPPGGSPPVPPGRNAPPPKDLPPVLY